MKTNGELIKDGGAAQESFEDIGIADEVIESDENAGSLSIVVGLLAMISQMPRLLRYLSKVAEMLTMLLMVKEAARESVEGPENVVKVDKGDEAAVESLEGCENADEGAEAAQETLDCSGTASKVVDSDKAATRDGLGLGLGFRSVSTAGLTNGALFLNVVEGELHLGME